MTTTDVQTRGPAVQETQSLSFAAYCHMRGMPIVRANEVRGRGNVEYAFAFADPDQRWEAFLIDWANSESGRYDSAVRTLKQLCKRNSGSR